MNPEQLKTRIKKIRSAMSLQKIDALTVTSPVNVTYLTAFSGDDSWAIITPRQVYLITDSRYTIQAQKESFGPKLCRIIQRKGPLTQAAQKILSRSKSIETVGVENTITIALFDRLKKLLTPAVKKTNNLVESVRTYKDPGEIAAIRIAAKIAQAALENITDNIKPDLTENQLAALLDLQIRWLGSYPSFETIVAFGPNAARPHHRPGSRKLKKNDTILIDFGATHKGYRSDLTRCFAVGKVSRFYAKVYKALWHAQQTAIEAVLPGADPNSVDLAAKNVLKKYNLPLYGHGTGHGLGLQVHEAPIVSGGAPKKSTLEPGQVITIEPGVYLPGKFGIRIEDDILITKTGAKVLSKKTSTEKVTVLTF